MHMVSKVSRGGYVLNSGIYEVHSEDDRWHHHTATTGDTVKSAE